MTGKQGNVRTKRALVIYGVLVAAGIVACDVQRKDRAHVGGTGSKGERTVAAVPAPSMERASTVLVSDPLPITEPAPERRVPENVTFGDAEAVFRRGDYAEAALLFEAYAQRRPENPWGHYMQGISLWRAGDHAGAEAALRRTLEVDSTHAKALLNLARVLLERGKPSDALDYVEKVVELEPESGQGWRVLGNAYSDLGMVKEAVSAYRRALVLDHRDAWTMNNLGLLMIREGRYEEALPPLARATELRPDVAVFQNNLGIALERTGHLPEAVVAFRAALDADPDYTKARVSLERVEPKVAQTTSPEPLDLMRLAGEFADEIERWKQMAREEREEKPVGSEMTGDVTGLDG